MSVLLDALVEHPEERLVLSGTSHATGAWADQPASLHGVLEALDEQVTLLKLLAALESPDAVMVSIGRENADVNLSTSALVSAGYGSGQHLDGRARRGRARPGWTIRERWPRSARSPGTSGRSSPVGDDRQCGRSSSRAGTESPVTASSDDRQ